MEKIEYREAVFDVIRTLSCERTRVKDAANNYLWTHWDLLVEVHWHPFLTSFQSGGIGQVAIAAQGKMPGETDVALLSRLLQPRGLLKITAGNSVILQTPAANMPCDVRGGPSVEVCSTPVQIGIKHWFVTLRFVADVRDILSDSQSAVISNLWVGTEDIDFQRRSTRRFAGRAILRADVMRRTNVNANSFRDLYLFKCPDHYQRQNVRVSLSEDGTTLDWSFEDAMRGYDLGSNSRIVSIEAFKTGYLTKGSPLKGIVDAVRQTARIAGQGSPISALAGFPWMQLDTQLDNIPKYFIQCRVDIVGDRNANLGDLTRIALGVCINQIDIVAGINSALTGTTEIIFRQDIADQVYTSVEMNKRMSDDALTFAGLVGGTFVNPITLFNNIVAANDLTVAALAQGSAAVIDSFQEDSTSIGTGPNGATIVADRSGLEAYKENPPLRQGAYGVVPASQNPANNVLGTVPGDAGKNPTGNMPTGIEKLIVQALLGQNVTPPSPTTLVNQS